MTPRQRTILIALAQIYVKLGKARRALLLVHPLLRGDADPAALRLSIQANIDLGRYDEAIAICDDFPVGEVSQEDRRSLHLLKTQALYRAGRRDEARMCFLETTPPSTDEKAA